MTTVGTKEDNHQSAEITQSDIKSHESINCIAKDELLISIENRGYDTSKKTPIDRVPILLRMNESFRNCFDPLVVSIGPYHFGKPHLKEFEQLKFPIAQKFCRTHGDQLSIEQLYDEVKKVGAIKCYAEVSNEYYEDEMFNRIMFRDALFVLRVMFMFSPHEDHEVQKAVDEDHEVQKAADERLAKSYYFVLRDLFLLENQIPLVVLKVLMELMFKDQGEKTVLLVDGFIEKIYPLLTMQSLEKVTGCCSKSAPKMEAESQVHLLQLVREKLIPPIITHKRKDITAFIGESKGMQSYRSVTDLKSAGIYFKPNETGNLTDVKFKSRLVSGVMTLPSIKVDHFTRPLLLNLVAYEMCPHGPHDLLITSYMCLMDSLIDHADDVKELKQKRILINKLGSDEKLAKFFNGMGYDLVPDPLAYFDVKSEIDAHCKLKRHVWMAEWTHKYFSSPWTLLAFLGAILALVLTVAQTFLAAYLL